MQSAQWLCRRETEVASVIVPDGFELASTQPSALVWVPHGETVEQWTRAFSMMSLKMQPDSITNLRELIKTNFYKTCGKKNIALSSDSPTALENGFQVAEWVMSCDLTVSGPSKGKPETNVYKWIKGKEVDLFIGMAFRFIPAAEDINSAKIIIDKATLRLK